VDPPHHEERRLITILAADVVGYSRLMAADESGTFARLRAHRKELIEPKTAEYHGRVVKLTGDGALMEFGSVVDAVLFAVDVQRAMAERDAAISEEHRIRYRIGINIGDIIVDGDDIYGDGINIAARLEGIAEPGGVYVSRSVYNQIKGKTDLGFEDLGEKQVKNIPDPVRVYRVDLSGKDTVNLSRRIDAGSLPLPDKPSIAVLPFQNMSGDPEQEYFADGIAEDIITALSRFHWFFVISRNTSLTYRGVDAKRVAEELGVHYVLEGSVRRSGNRVRITTQLIDARVDHHVWAEHYDRDLEDIFAVQDEITERVITSVAPGIVSAEMQRAYRKDITSLDAWERIMRAHWHLARFTMEDNAEARRLLTEAAQIEPNSSLALGDLAMIHTFDGQWGWGGSRDQSLALAAEAARRAVAIDKGSAWAHIALGFVELFAGRHSESVHRLERAIEISPNDPHAHGHLGFTLSFSGESQAAIARIEAAIRLSPRDPFLAFWYTARSLAAFSAEQYEAAVEWARKTVDENPRHPGAYRLLATSYAQMGDIEEAKLALEEMLHQMPGITVTATRQQVPWKKHDDAQHYLDGLRKAGLPE
jgi:TolB-like protein/Flp pilus assembly protein TadD